ncbi:MAG: protein phosphatase CheZ [Parvibaculum sp.]
MVTTPMTNDDVAEFSSILIAVQETPKGRWFLEEFERRNRVADTDMLLQAIATLRTEAAETLKAATVPSDTMTMTALRRELEEMSATIRDTRVAIASIKPEENGNNRIMMASEELDAIVSSTERATSEILAGAERIQEISDKLREQGGDEDLCDEIESHATSIFMACSFQDITGQRTSKVVGVLKYLEHRLNYMVSLWDGTAAGSLSNLDDNLPKDERPDAHLLTGPQAEDVAPDQDQIDNIFDDIAFLDADETVGGEPVSQDISAPDAINEVDLEIEPTQPPAKQSAIKTAHGDLDFASADTSVNTSHEESTPGDIMAAGEEVDQDDIDALFN